MRQFKHGASSQRQPYSFSPEWPEDATWWFACSTSGVPRFPDWAWAGVIPSGFALNLLTLFYFILSYFIISCICYLSPFPSSSFPCLDFLFPSPSLDLQSRSLPFFERRFLIYLAIILALSLLFLFLILTLTIARKARWDLTVLHPVSWAVPVLQTGRPPPMVLQIPNSRRFPLKTFVQKAAPNPALMLLWMMADSVDSIRCKYRERPVSKNRDLATDPIQAFLRSLSGSGKQFEPHATVADGSKLHSSLHDWEHVWSKSTPVSIGSKLFKCRPVGCQFWPRNAWSCTRSCQVQWN